jgi:hypothetical protein
MANAQFMHLQIYKHALTTRPCTAPGKGQGLGAQEAGAGGKSEGERGIGILRTLKRKNVVRPVYYFTRSRSEREVSLLDKLKRVPTCQRYCRWSSDVTAATIKLNRQQGYIPGFVLYFSKDSMCPYAPLAPEVTNLQNSNTRERGESWARDLTLKKL